MVEAVGVEPTSEDFARVVSTSLAKMFRLSRSKEENNLSRPTSEHLLANVLKGPAHKF